MALRFRIDEKPIMNGTSVERVYLKDTTVTVYPNTGDPTDEVVARDEQRFGGKSWATTVNWSALGSVSPDVATAYAEAIIYAGQLIDGVRQQREIVHLQVAAYEAQRAEVKA